MSLLFVFLLPKILTLSLSLPFSINMSFFDSESASYARDWWCYKFFRQITCGRNLSLSFDLFGCVYDVVSLMTFQGCCTRCLDLPKQEIQKLERCFCCYFTFSLDFLRVGVENRRFFHHICLLPTTETLHVSGAFMFLTKSRFDHSSCFLQAWFWDRFDIVCLS